MGNNHIYAVIITLSLHICFVSCVTQSRKKVVILLGLCLSVHSEPKPILHKHETGSMEVHFDPLFQLPFTALLLGASGSGKSVFVKQVIQNMEQTSSRLLDRIIWCYSSYQPMYDEFAESVSLRFIEGIPESLTDESIFRSN